MNPSSFSIVSSSFWRTRTRTNDEEELTSENIDCFLEDDIGWWPVSRAAIVADPVTATQSYQKRVSTPAADREVSAGKVRASRHCGTVSVDIDLFRCRFAHSHSSGPAHR